MLNVIILAAGQGTRMRSSLPKVLHKIGGQTMLSHILESARQLRPAKVLVVVGHGAELIQQSFAGQDMQFVQQQQQLGTGHAVQQALPHLRAGTAEDVTLVLYGDVPLVQTATLTTLLQARAGGLALLTERLTDPSGYGRIVRDNQGRILGIVEHKDASPEQLAISEVNTGIMAVGTADLCRWLGMINNHNSQGEYYLTDIVALAAAEGSAISSAQPAHNWETFGVNSRLQQAQLERLWQAEQATRLLSQGVALADPARFDLRGSLQCGQDVFIDVGCVFAGSVQLADGVQIGPHCVIKDAVLGANSRVHAYSHIEGAQLAQDTSIGPYARLRPGTQIEAGAHVGNFVELKKTRLGQQSKANHLAYLGDADIGARVNIGAGTITCNYDGVNKFQTIIEDDVFVGSDSQLVAPVKLGRGATLGAGTTLTRDAPAGQLTVARVAQKTINNWQRPKEKK